MLACIAMVTDNTYQAVLLAAGRLGVVKDITLPLKRGLTAEEAVKIIHDLDHDYELTYPANFLGEGVYIISVPSLNTMGGLHSVVVDLDEDFEVLDPQEGNIRTFGVYTSDNLRTFAEVKRVFPCRGTPRGSR